MNSTRGRSGFALKIGTLASILVLLASGLPVEAAPFAYVADFGSGVVSVIDLETNTEIVKISTPSLAPPYHAAVTPDGARVYVSSGFFGGTVTVIDTITNRVVVPEIIVGPGAGGLAVSPDGKFLYVAIRQQDKVSVISTATHQVVATIPVGAFPNDVAVTPDGSRVYVASHSSAVTVIDTSNHTVMTSISVAPHSEEIVVSPRRIRGLRQQYHCRDGLGDRSNLEHRFGDDCRRLRCAGHGRDARRHAIVRRGHR